MGNRLKASFAISVSLLLGGCANQCRVSEPVAPVPVQAAAPAAVPAPAPVVPPQVGTTMLSLEGTNFDFNKAILHPEALAKLDHVAEVLTQNPAVKVSVEGHTDSVGSARYNQKLSERRAQAVVKYLSSKGIDASRLSPAGYGKTRPAASNQTSEGRARNRRVDLVVAK